MAGRWRYDRAWVTWASALVAGVTGRQAGGFPSGVAVD
jgi:hypothetical protein